MSNRHASGKLYPHTTTREEAVKKQAEQEAGGGGEVPTTFVAATPVGVPVPSGSAKWSVAYADGFTVPIGLGAGQDNTWYPNIPTTNPALPPTTYQHPNNANEPLVYNSSQVKVDSEGLKLVLARITNVGGTGRNYVGGTIHSEAEGYTGAKLFRWKPTIGQSFALEIVCKLPPNTSEMNPAFWSLDYNWTDELDHPEWWGWPAPAGEYYAGVPVWIYKTPSSSIRAESGWGKKPWGFDPTAAFHRYTTVINGDQSVHFYIDGTFRWNTEPEKPPAEPNRPFMGLVVQCSLREASEGRTSGFTSGTRTLAVRSVAVYTDSAHEGQNMQNPGLAPGTVVK